MVSVSAIVVALFFAANLFADNFLVLGPLAPEKVNVRKLVDDYKSNIISSNIWNSNWNLPSGEKLAWNSCLYKINPKADNNQKIQFKNLKTAKAGETYVFQTVIDNSKEQLVRFIGDIKSFKFIFLNGKQVYGGCASLPKGKNQLVLVYIVSRNPLSRGGGACPAYAGEGRGVLSYGIPFCIIGAQSGKRLDNISFSTKQFKKSVILPKNTDGKLKFFITDKSTGKKKPCRLYVFNKKGRPQYDDKYPDCFETFTCNGEAELFLPEGDYTFEVESGKEFYNVKGKVKIKKDKTINRKIMLERFSDINKEGWFAGDMHNHTKIDYTPLLMESENIHIGYVPSWWINPPMGRTSAKELTNLPQLIKLKNNRFLYTRTGEDERNDCTLIFFGMPEDVIIPEAAWTYPPNVHFAKKFGKISNVWVHLDHMYWWQTPAVLACGELDSIEVINNNFVRGGMNQTEAWGKPRDKKKYPNPYGNAEYQQDVYFKILNSGFRIPPGAGSAAPVGGGPFGYNRVYVHVDGKLTWGKWWKNLKAGKCFLTCGPLLRVTANNKLPGHIFKAKKSIKIKPDIKLDSRDKITAIQIIKNGKIEKSVPYAEWIKTNDIGSITFKKSGWFLIRALTDNPGTYRFAMTGPYYVEIGDSPKRIDKESVEFFLNWAKEAAKRNPETTPDKCALVDKYSKETIKFWKNLLKKSK